jgi:hypothetical protein
MYVFGGWDNRDYFNDMYYVDLDSEPKRWHLVKQNGNIPKPIRDHSAVLFEDKIIIWGGCGGFDIEELEMVFFQKVQVFCLKRHVWEYPNTLGEIPPATEAHQSLLVKNRTASILFFL